MHAMDKGRDCSCVEVKNSRDMAALSRKLYRN